MVPRSIGDGFSRSMKLAAMCAVGIMALAGSVHGQETVPSNLTGFGLLESGSGVDLFPDLATDGNGTWIAVYSSNDTLGGTIGGDTDILFSASTDNGLTWTSPQPVNTDAAVDGFEDVTPQIEHNGTVFLVVWDGGGVVFIATSADGFTWTNPAGINGLAGTNPSAARATDNTTVVVAENAGAVVSSDGTTNATVAASGANPDVATNNTGVFVAAFESAADIGVSAGDGATWSAVQTLDSGQVDAGPAVAFDGTDTFFVFWLSGNGGVWVSMSTDNGATWSIAEEAIPDSADLTSDVDVATDANGAWVAIWASTSGITYSNSTDNVATWSAPIAVTPSSSPLNVTDVTSRVLARQLETGERLRPQIATDRAGLWMLVSEVQAGLERGLDFADNQVRVVGDDDDDDGPCFIASAAFGTPMANEINVLRDARDSYLMNNALGLFFVDAYYQVSPVIADQVAQHPWMAAVVRAVLVPVLMLTELLMIAPVSFMLIALFGAALVGRNVARRRTA